MINEKEKWETIERNYNKPNDTKTLDYEDVLCEVIHTQNERIQLLYDLLLKATEWFSVNQKVLLMGYGDDDMPTIDEGKLVIESMKMDIEIKRTYDKYSGCANAYHKSVWEKVYPNTKETNYGGFIDMPSKLIKEK